MSPYPTRDLEALKKMGEHLAMFQAKLNEEIPHHEKQIIAAAIVELKHNIAWKTRDIKRRLRETWEY